MKVILPPDLLRFLRQLAKLASQIYIGRSGNPKKRLLAHAKSYRQLTCLSVLYWVDGYDEADAVEMAVIAELKRYSLKMTNGDAGGTGPFADQRHHAIYLAWNPKLGESIHSVGGFHVVTDIGTWDLGSSVPLHLTMDPRAASSSSLIANRGLGRRRHDLR